MRVILTSCGLETAALRDAFRAMLRNDPATARALFVVAAAGDPDAIQVLPKCLNDLLNAGFAKENIVVCDLYAPVSAQALQGFDLVYLCGGSTERLLTRMRDQGFDAALTDYIRANGMVLGVSAGSCVFAANLPGGLGLIRSPLRVHCADTDCETPGTLDISRPEPIRLGNRQGIALTDERHARVLA